MAVSSVHYFVTGQGFVFCSTRCNPSSFTLLCVGFVLPHYRHVAVRIDLLQVPRYAADGVCFSPKDLVTNAPEMLYSFGMNSFSVDL